MIKTIWGKKHAWRQRAEEIVTRITGKVLRGSSVLLVYKTQPSGEKLFESPKECMGPDKSLPSSSFLKNSLSFCLAVSEVAARKGYLPQKNQSCPGWTQYRQRHIQAGNCSLSIHFLPFFFFLQFS